MLYDTNQLVLLGHGTQKNVYQHPEDPNKVIKVMLASRAGKDGGIINQNRWRRHFSQGIYRQFRRQILQYMQLCKNNYHSKRFIFPIETFYGFVATDQGLGLVSEKIIAPSGRGMTLDELCRQKIFQAHHAAALQQFFAECSALHVVFGEVNKAGIMYTVSRTGRPEFVLVDGIGEKLFIPIRAMSKRINSSYIRKVEQRIKKQLGIDY
jgi:hypothetical protein